MTYYSVKRKLSPYFNCGFFLFIKTKTLNNMTSPLFFSFLLDLILMRKTEGGTKKRGSYMHLNFK